MKETPEKTGVSFYRLVADGILLSSENQTGTIPRTVLEFHFPAFLAEHGDKSLERSLTKVEVRHLDR